MEVCQTDPMSWGYFQDGYYLLPCISIIHIYIFILLQYCTGLDIWEIVFFSMIATEYQVCILHIKLIGLYQTLLK